MDHLKAAIKNRSAELSKERKRLEGVKAALQEAAGRFDAPSDGENLLRAVALSHVADVERSMAGFAASIALNNRALDLLKQFSYRADVKAYAAVARNWMGSTASANSMYFP